MTTASQVIEEARRHLFSGYREQVNVLAANYTANGTSLTFTYPLKSITEGSLLEIDLELFQVLSVDSAALTAVVLPAQLGTVAANHSSGAVVSVNPKFPRFSILAAVNNELNGLSSEGLFQVKTVDLTYNAAVNGYDLTGVTDILDIYQIRYQVPGPYKTWPRIDRWDFARDMPTTDFASSSALLLFEGGWPGRDIRVSYRAPFTTLANLTDDVETVSGLHADAHDILSLGAAARLVLPRDVKRSFTEQQGETRRADEVPVGAAQTSARGLLLLRDRRVQQEIARLRRFYPPHQAG